MFGGRVARPGGATLHYRVVEWLPESEAQLDLR
jgi:hypothetical protein